MTTQPRSQAVRATHHFCSPTCKARWQSIHLVGERNHAYSSTAVPCAQCGTLVSKRAARRRRNIRSFCSRACYALFRRGRFTGPENGTWRGGYRDYYGPNWRDQQRKARARDNRTCRGCGATESMLNRKLDVHHVTPFRAFGYVPGENEHYRLANRLTNLVSLCPRCHRKAERGRLTIPGVSLPS